MYVASLISSHLTHSILAQLIEIDENTRVSFARLIVGLNEENKELVLQAWNELGQEFLWKSTNTHNPKVVNM